MDFQKIYREQSLFSPGHRGCPGCGLALAVRHILRATGPKVHVVTPTGCLETISSCYGFSSWGVPWIHHVFENGPCIATGVARALRRQGREDERVIGIGGDGSTFDIGFGALSGMLERDEDVLYICTDNASYGNTGGQRSGATPLFASTTTEPGSDLALGKLEHKKDLPSIVAAHDIAYVATASIGYLKDLERKVRKAMTFRGARYIQIDQPCTTVWGYPAEMTLEYARRAVQSGITPLFEMERGSLTGVRKITKRIPVEEYLRGQKRFAHLFSHPNGQEAIGAIQAAADRNIERYGLLA